MITVQTQLKELVAQIVRDAEAAAGHRLTIEDFDFLVGTTTEFVEANIGKFIAGGKEHSDGVFLTEVDHLSELYKEQLDSFNYLAAARWNKRKHDRRY